MTAIDISDKTVSQDMRDLFGTLVMLDGSATWNAASIADGDMEAKDITVTGAALGDFVLVSPSIDVTDLQLTGTVTAADTVTAVLSNSTGGAVDLASMTVYARVFTRGNTLSA